MSGNQKIKILWLSANLLGYRLLKTALKIKEVEIIGVLTLSDKSKTKIYDGIDKRKWYSFGIPVFEIQNINEEIKLLKSLQPTFIIMCGWRQLIDKKILDLSKRGVVGFHPTLLPKGRGPAPIINTILEGYKESGVTMFYVNKGFDSGDIIGQRKFEVRDDDYAMDIYRKVIKKGEELIKFYLPKLAENNTPRIAQNESEATYFPKRNMKDNEIKLDSSPEDIYRKIRAFSKPYKGAYIKINDKKFIIWGDLIQNGKNF